MARVIVPSDSPIITIRLTNTNEEEVHLEKGDCLGERCAVQLGEEAEKPDENPYETIVEEMIDRVDIVVDNDTKRVLRQILLG